MVTSTGRHTFFNITETGRSSFTNISETGEYAPTAYIILGPGMVLSGGSVVGGAFTYASSAAVTMSCSTAFGGLSVFAAGYELIASGGFIAGGSIGSGSGYVITDRVGMVAGGAMLLTSSDWTCGAVAGGISLFGSTVNYNTFCGMITGGASIKKQFTVVSAAAGSISPTLIDASIKFKLEVAP